MWELRTERIITWEWTPLKWFYTWLLSLFNHSRERLPILGALSLQPGNIYVILHCIQYWWYNKDWTNCFCSPHTIGTLRRRCFILSKTVILYWSRLFMGSISNSCKQEFVVLISGSCWNHLGRGMSGGASFIVYHSSFRYYITQIYKPLI